MTVEPVVVLELPEEAADIASVVTVPSTAILRMVALPESTTKTLPAPSTAKPRGWLNKALGEAPSRRPAMPAMPADVVTTPDAVTLRIVPLPVSATRTFPLPSTAIP